MINWQARVDALIREARCGDASLYAFNLGKAQGLAEAIAGHRPSAEMRFARDDYANGYMAGFAEHQQQQCDHDFPERDRFGSRICLGCGNAVR